MVLSDTDLGHGTFHRRIVHEDANMGKSGYKAPATKVKAVQLVASEMLLAH